LYELVEAQCNYHTQAKELFETVKNNWGKGSNSDPTSNIIIRSNSMQSFHTMSSNYQYTPENSNSSCCSNSIHTVDHPTSLSSASIPIRSPLPQHVPPSRQSTQEVIKYRKATFDFNGQNNDEISFKTGDIISVIDEIDKGWWLGEVYSKKGIFPVNYTEEYDPQAHPLPSLPPIEKKEEIIPSTTTVPHQTTSATVPQQTTSNTTSSTTTRRPPPPPSSISSPVISNIGVSRTKSTAIRPPPPPPPTVTHSTTPATRQNSLDSQDNTTILSHQVIHQEPVSYSHHNEDLSSIKSNSPIISSSLLHSEPEPESTIPCHECDCDGYVPNLFKKGYCNSCFHKHV
jgi:hypothetical protein